MRLNELYARYKDQVAFHIVYIREAHPGDGWQVPENLVENIIIDEPTTDQARTEAAAGIIRMVEQNLLHAVERVSIQRGYNSGRFMLIACGGAGPMHGASVGRRLDANAVYVPRQAGAFCAIGMQHADVRRDFVHVLMRQLDDDAAAAVQHGYRMLETQALAALQEEGFAASSTTFGHELDLHYEGQQ